MEEKTCVREILDSAWLLKHDHLFNCLLLLKDRSSFKMSLKKFTQRCFALLAKVSNKNSSSFVMSTIVLLWNHQKLRCRRNPKIHQRNHRTPLILRMNARTTVHHQEKELAEKEMEVEERVACADGFEEVLFCCES